MSAKYYHDFYMHDICMLTHHAMPTMQPELFPAQIRTSGYVAKTKSRLLQLTFVAKLVDYHTDQAS